MTKPTTSNQHGGDPGWPAKDPDGGKSGGGRKNAVRRKPLQAKGKGGGAPNWPARGGGCPAGGGRKNSARRQPHLAKGGPRPPNGPSTTGEKSGGNRGNNPPGK